MWEDISGLYGLDESQSPWIARLLSLIIASQPNIGSQFRRAWGGMPSGRGAPDWEELQAIIETAQTKETATDPKFNPFLQMLFPEYIQPQRFDFEELMQRKLPKGLEMLFPQFRDMSPEAKGFQFQTRPGEIFRPELPVRVRAPEVLEKKQKERFDRLISYEKAGREEQAKEEYNKLFGGVGVGFELFKTLPEGMKKTFFRRFYPEEKAKAPTKETLPAYRQRAQLYERLKTLKNMGSPMTVTQQAELNKLEAEFGKEKKVPLKTPTLESLYRQSKEAMMGVPFETWYVKSGIGQPIGKIEKGAEPTIPLWIKIQLKASGSYQKWYDTLSKKDKKSLSPEEEKLIKQWLEWYGIVR